MPQQIIKAAACAVFSTFFAGSGSHQCTSRTFDRFTSLGFHCRVVSFTHEVVIVWPPDLPSAQLVRCLDIAHGDDFAACRGSAAFAWVDWLVRQNRARFALLGEHKLLFSVFPPEVMELGEYGSRACLDLPLPASVGEYPTPSPLVLGPDLSILW